MTARHTLDRLHELGPMYEDFAVGDTIPPLPPVTFTDGDNVLHRAITGDQHRFAADRDAYHAAGGRGSLVNPAIVMQYSIGQTTNTTRRAIANLYYRSVRVLRPVEVGETMSTTATVLGLHDSAPKDGRHRGKVWIGIRSSTAAGTVAEYERCALLPARGNEPCGHADTIPGPSDPVPLADLDPLVPAWDLGALAKVEWPVGETRTDPLRDHIDMAAPLARLTFNQAAVHRDASSTVNGRRLVYGGHVQALAQASLTRLLPGLAAVVAWDGCDHLGPAYEGDLLELRHTLVETRPAGTGRLMRFEVLAGRPGVGAGADAPSDLLRWTPVVWAP